MSLPCPVATCARDMPGNATICGACSAELGRALHTVTWLADELDVTLSKQHTRTGGGTTELEDDPTPAVLHIGTLGYDPRASEARDVLRSTLVGWVRVMAEGWTAPHGPVCRSCTHPSCILATGPDDTCQSMAAWLWMGLERLAAHPAAEEAHEEITAAVYRAQRVIDRDPDRRYAGICAAPLRNGDRCQRDLYARPGAATVTCPTCHTRWDVAERRTWLLGLAEDVLATATEIARAVTRLGRPVTPAAIRGYAHRGAIIPHGEDERGRPRYRVGDVLDVVARHAARESERLTS